MPVVLFVGLLWLYTANNRFPYFYHTDEPGKAAQVIEGRRNFHHPLLMITSAELGVRLLGLEKTEQNVVVAGRWYSAVCASLAAVAVMLFVAGYYGWILGTVAALVVGLHPLLFEAAHYMKEDCGLLMGLMWSLLLLDRYARQPVTRNLLLAGIACGVTAGAKYIGATVLLPAICVVLIKSRSEGVVVVLKRAGLLLLVAVAAFGVINFQAITNYSAALGGLDHEFRNMERVKTKPGDSDDSDYMGKLATQAHPFIFALAGLYLLACAWKRRRATVMEWVLPAFAAVYLLVIQLSPLGKLRYLLPDVVMLCIMAVMALGCLVEMLRARWPRLTWVGLLLVLYPCQMVLKEQRRTVRQAQREFSDTAYKDLIAWIKTNIPPDAKIAYDTRIWLGEFKKLGPDYAVPQPVINIEEQLRALRSLTDLRAEGVRYYVLTSVDYRKFPRVDNPRSEFKRLGAEFYPELFSKGKVIHKVKKRLIRYLLPGFEVVEVPPLTTPGEAVSP